jgi:hypothetical protein
MQTPLLLALSLTVVAIPARAGAPSPARVSADCGEEARAAGEGSCDGELLCAPAERVEIACELRQAIASRWVFRSVKPALLAAAGRPALDVERHLDGCVDAERAIAREDDPLRFYDRLRRCAAALEDGHLLPSVPGGLPTVALGVGLRLASDGAVHVASRAPGVVRWLESEGGVPDAGALLAPGTVVAAIDGAPVDDVLSGLARHVPAGSAAARRERAVDALTRRDFAHPRARDATLTLVTRGGLRDLKLRWWVSPDAERIAAARPWLRATGIGTTGLVDWRASPRTSAGDPAAGAARTDPAVAPADARLLVEYRGDAGQLAARLGEATAADGGRFCYAQLLTLHTDDLSAGGRRRPLVDVVAEHVAACRDRGLDLVLDLRENEGGWISHAAALARLVAPGGAPAARGALLFRANEHNERVFRARAPALAPLRPLWNGPRTEAEEVLDAIRAARAAGEELAPAFVDPPAAAAREGFDGRVVALVAPTCMSACERLAAMLREGGAVLVGGPTEGAGGSQQEAKGLPARWVDSSGRFALSIPTAAMGVLRGGAAADRTTSAARFFSDLALENRPVRPDVPYETTVEDLVGANEGWRAAAEAALRDPAPARLAGPSAPRA